MNEPRIKTANKSNGSIFLAIAIVGALHFFLLGQLYTHVGPQEAGKFIGGVVLLLISFFSILVAINNFRFKVFKCPNCRLRIGKIEPHGKVPGDPIYQYCYCCSTLWLVGKVPGRILAAGADASDSGAGGE
ncbi:hypothetical protein [Microbulbifer sp. VVAC002]|uniref:hypothetical protein n=1 Tax=Microbulbifer sp. VVAC002 TaxID=3243387 RepID=UPI0040390E98